MNSIESGQAGKGGPPSQAWFATTQWSVVLDATGEDLPLRTKAWEELYRVYWAPIYAYIRRTGYRSRQISLNRMVALPI